MSDNMDFEEYIRQGEPDKKEKASDMFAQHSWYFRNALVRANYKNAVNGIDYSPVYLERFFRNLLLGEKWDLRNRYLHINPTKEWGEQPNLSTPTSTPSSTPASSDILSELVRVIGCLELSVKQMMDLKGLKDRKNFMDYHLSPAIEEGLVRMKYPDSPRHPRQKYLLTDKGLALYKKLGEK